jgi:hypothetical protein
MACLIVPILRPVSLFESPFRVTGPVFHFELPERLHPLECFVKSVFLHVVGLSTGAHSFSFTLEALVAPRDLLIQSGLCWSPLRSPKGNWTVLIPSHLADAVVYSVQ